MGKTYKNVNAGSNSVDYHSPNNRGFAKVKKQHSHRKVRTHNKYCSEDDIISLKQLNGNQIMNNHFASRYYGELGNIPNRPDFNFYNKELLRKHYNVEWKKEDLSDLDTINRAIDEGNKNPEFKMCKKQIERRGNIGLFYGHRLKNF
jgi:hypothetical protein